MNYAYFALAGAFLSACVNFTDKYLINSSTKEAKSIMVFSGFISGAVGVFVYLFFKPPLPSFIDLVVVLLSGVFISFATAIYFYLIHKDHVGFGVLAFQLIPVFVFIGGVVFFRETITLIQVFSSLLIVLSSFAIVITDHKSDYFEWKASRKSGILLVLCSFFWSASIFLIKISSNRLEFSQIVSFEQMGILFGTLILLFVRSEYRIDLIGSLKKFNFAKLSVLFFNEGVLIPVAKTLFNYAYVTGIISVSSVLESTQVVFVIVIGYILTKFNPKYFSENTSLVSLRRKIVFVFFMLIGVFFIIT